MNGKNHMESIGWVLIALLPKRASNKERGMIDILQPFANPLEHQRSHLLTPGNRTGFRPESLQHMHVESFKQCAVEDGRPYMQIVMGRTKKLPGGIDKVGAAVFRQSAPLSRQTGS